MPWLNIMTFISHSCGPPPYISYVFRSYGNKLSPKGKWQIPLKYVCHLPFGPVILILKHRHNCLAKLYPAFHNNILRIHSQRFIKAHGRFIKGPYLQLHPVDSHRPDYVRQRLIERFSHTHMPEIFKDADIVNVGIASGHHHRVGRSLLQLDITYARSPAVCLGYQEEGILDRKSVV